MSIPSVAFGIFVFVLLAGSHAQQFSNFNDIPQSYLDKLSSSQIENIKKALSGAGGGNGGGDSGIETFQIGGGSSGGGTDDGGQSLNEDEEESPQQDNTEAGPSEEQGQSGGGSPGMQTFQFSSFSQIPQALLDQLPPEQVENLRNNIPAHGRMPSSPQTQPSAATPQAQPPSNPGGGSSPGQRTFQFNSFSSIPHSQIQNLKNQIPAQGKIPSTPQAQPPSNPSGGSSPGQRTFQFNSFSSIPQSLLDQLSDSQIQNLKNQIPAQGKIPSTQQQQNPSSPQDQMPSSSSIPTFQVGGGGGIPMNGQTLQFSKFSDIPQSVLNRLSSDQIERIRKLLSQQKQTMTITPKPQPQPQPRQQTFEFSSFSQIPNSILSQFSSEQIREIKETLAGQQNGSKRSNRVTYNIPAGDNKRENDFLNIVFNYVAVGGYLTGIPPIDLLLLRFYLQTGPTNFC